MEIYIAGFLTNFVIWMIILTIAIIKRRNPKKIKRGMILMVILSTLSWVGVGITFLMILYAIIEVNAEKNNK